jgi:hypothetical protein
LNAWKFADKSGASLRHVGILTVTSSGDAKRRHKVFLKSNTLKKRDRRKDKKNEVGHEEYDLLGYDDM